MLAHFPKADCLPLLRNSLKLVVCLLHACITSNTLGNIKIWGRMHCCLWPFPRQNFFLGPRRIHRFSWLFFLDCPSLLCPPRSHVNTSPLMDYGIVIALDLPLMHRRTRDAIEVAHLLLVRKAVIHSRTSMLILFNDQSTLCGVVRPPDRHLDVPVKILDHVGLGGHAVARQGEKELERGQPLPHDLAPSPLLLHVHLDHELVVGAPDVTDKDQVFVCILAVLLCRLVGKADIKKLDSIRFLDPERGRVVEMEPIGKELGKQGYVNPGRCSPRKRQSMEYRYTHHHVSNYTLTDVP
jgi:hypothetical protein